MAGESLRGACRAGLANDEKGSGNVKIKVGSATVAVLVALMLWLLVSHSVDWLLSTGLPH